jgi:Fe-S-cluster-containing dehydrogenase component
VIDYERCAGCKQCLNFCLFGVYSLAGDDRVTVSAPRGCKENCPACARICPEAAIIFPKSEEPVICGSEIEDEHALRARIKIDVDEILGEDVYTALAERRARARRRLVDRRKMAEALAERAACSGEASPSGQGRPAGHLDADGGQA